MNEDQDCRLKDMVDVYMGAYANEVPQHAKDLINWMADFGDQVIEMKDRCVELIEKDRKIIGNYRRLEAQNGRMMAMLDQAIKIGHEYAEANVGLGAELEATHAALDAVTGPCFRVKVADKLKDSPWSRAKARDEQQGR